MCLDFKEEKVSQIGIIISCRNNKMCLLHELDLRCEMERETILIRMYV